MSVFTRWLNDSRNRIVNTMAAGKSVYCEAQTAENPGNFWIYRQPPAVMRWVAPTLWARAFPLATSSAVVTPFGTWISDQPWQTPHQPQHLGTATYRFATASGLGSPPLRVGHKVAFIERHSAAGQIQVDAGVPLEPSASVLNVTAGGSVDRAVTFSGEVFGIEDPRVVARLLDGEALYEAVIGDLRSWIQEIEAPHEERRLNEDALRWIMQVRPPVETTFSTSVLDVPEGAARLLQGRTVLAGDGPFAFAIELVDEESDNVLTTSDPVIGFSQSVQVFSRFM